MTLGFDNVTGTTLNAVTEVQLNAGLPLTTPDKASALLEIVPYFSEVGAFSPDQSLQMFMRIQSDDVAIEPKRFSLPVVSGGTAAAFGTVGAPPLVAMPLNIDLSVSRQARINYFANDQVVNTVEPSCGATVVYDTDGVSMPEQFYQKPDNEFLSGTTAGSRTTSVSAITITGGREINMLICQVGAGASAASEQLFGFMEFSSSDFLTSLPYRVAFQPTNVGIGESGSIASTQAGTGIQIYNMPIGKGIPIAGRTVIDEAITILDSWATAANVVGGVGYIK